MDSSPQKMSRRKALATMAGAVGLAALPGVGHALNPIKKERRDIQTSAFTSIHTMRNAVSRQFTTFDLNTKIKAHLVELHQLRTEILFIKRVRAKFALTLVQSVGVPAHSSILTR